MSDTELKALIAEVAKLQAEVARQQVELDKRRAEDLARTEAEKRLTEKSFQQVNAQLGGLGNKFGSFTEGLAFESMEKILRTTFHADTVARRVKSLRGREAQGFGAQEFDMIGERNGIHQEIYCVEIKSELNLKELEKSVKKFRQFFDLFPKYRDMKLYGIISAVDVRGAMAERVLHEGLYLATASDNNFKLVKPPRDFKPRAFIAADK